MLVNVRCQRLGSWTGKRRTPQKNKEPVQDFGNLSRSWIVYYHFPKYQKVFGDALFTYQFVILIVSRITYAYLTISF